MKIFSYALRSVGRNRQRTVVTVSAMAFAGFIMIFFMALMEGFVDNMERNAIGMDLGDIQIHAKGYRDDPDLYKRINDPQRLVKTLKAAGFAASPRLYGFGLAASGSSSSGVMMRGIDLVNEPTVTQLYKHVAKGEWLDESEPKGVVIGKKLARTLGVKTGDELIILSQATDGSMANDLYTVRGILKSVGDAVDRASLLMTENAFRNLMVLPQGAHEIAVMRGDRLVELVPATKTVQALAQEMEVNNWRELQPVLAKMIDSIDGSMIMMLVISYVAIAMVVLNATLMSVFERIHELGVMKAVGLSPLRIVALIYTEAMIKAVAASMLAVAAGIPVSLYFQSNGIDITALGSGGSIGGIALDTVWYARLTVSAVTTPVVLLFVVVVVAVVYPAVKAAVIIPVKAIHYR